MRAKKVDWLDSKRFADDYSDDNNSGGGGAIPSLSEPFLTIVHLADSNKCIDDEAALLIARHLFELKDWIIAKTKAYKLSFGCNILHIGSKEIKANRYAWSDGVYVYNVKLGYDPYSNIVVYNEKVTRVKMN